MRQWLLAIAVMVGLGVVSLAVPAPVAMAGLASGGLQNTSGGPNEHAGQTLQVGSLVVATSGNINLDGTTNSDNGLTWNGTTGAWRVGGASALAAVPGAGTITAANGYTLVVPAAKIGTSGTTIASSMRGTATLDFASAAAGACSAVLTITVTGAVAGTEVALGVPNASNTTGSQFTAWVSATDTVSVKHCCENGTCDPASGTFSARVFNP